MYKCVKDMFRMHTLKADVPCLIYRRHNTSEVMLLHNNYYYYVFSTASFTPPMIHRRISRHSVRIHRFCTTTQAWNMHSVNRNTIISLCGCAVYSVKLRDENYAIQITHHPECMKFSSCDLSSGVGGFLQMDLEPVFP